MNSKKVKEAGYDDEAKTGLLHTYHALVCLAEYEVPSKKVGEKSAPLNLT